MAKKKTKAHVWVSRPLRPQRMLAEWRKWQPAVARLRAHRAAEFTHATSTHTVPFRIEIPKGLPGSPVATWQKEKPRRKRVAKRHTHARTPNYRTVCGYDA